MSPGRYGVLVRVAGSLAGFAVRALNRLPVPRPEIGRALRPSGTVNVTTTDTPYFFMLSSIFSDFCQKHSDFVAEAARRRFQLPDEAPLRDLGQIGRAHV